MHLVVDTLANPVFPVETTPASHIFAVFDPSVFVHRAGPFIGDRKRVLQDHQDEAAAQGGPQPGHPGGGLRRRSFVMGRFFSSPRSMSLSLSWCLSYCSGDVRLLQAFPRAVVGPVVVLSQHTVSETVHVERVPSVHWSISCCGSNCKREGCLLLLLVFCGVAWLHSHSSFWVDMCETISEFRILLLFLWEGVPDSERICGCTVRETRKFVHAKNRRFV